MSVPLTGFPRPEYQYDYQNESQFRAAVESAIASLDAAISEGIEVIASDLTFEGAQTFDGSVTFNGAVTASAVAIDFSSATSFSFPVASVTEAMVTQHQAALSIAFTQLTGQIANAQVPVGAVTQHEGAIDHDALLGFVAAEHIRWDLTGAEDIHADRIAEAAVTQHQAALSIAWSQITATPTTVAGYGITDALTASYTGNITGAWDFTATDGLSVSGAAVAPTATGSQLLVRDQNDGDAVKYINPPTADSNTYFLRYNSSAGGFTWGTTVPAPDELNDVGDVTITTAASRDFLLWSGSAWVNDEIAPGDLGATLGTSAFLKLTPGGPPTMDWAGITEADITDLQSYLLPSFSGNITGAWDFTATDGLSVSGAAIAPTATGSQILVRDQNDGDAVKYLNAPTADSNTYFLRYNSSAGGFTWGDIDGTLDAATLDGQSPSYYLDLANHTGVLPTDHIAESAATQIGQVLQITLSGPFRATWEALDISDIAAGTAPSGTFRFTSMRVDDLEIGQSVQTYTTMAATDWDRETGTRIFVNASASTGEPSGASKGIWLTVGRRDTSAGYYGLYLEDAGRLWTGVRDDNSTDGSPTWLRMVDTAYSGNISGAFDFTATDGLSVSGAALAPTATGSQLLVRDGADGDAVKYLNAPTADSTTYYLRYNSAAGGFTWAATIPVSGDLGDLDNVSEAGVASGDFLQYSGSAWVPVEIDPGDLGATLGSSAFLKLTPGGPPTMDWSGIDGTDITTGVISPDRLADTILGETPYTNIVQYDRFVSTDDLDDMREAGVYGLHTNTMPNYPSNGSGYDPMLVMRSPSDVGAQLVVPRNSDTSTLAFRGWSSSGGSWTIWKYVALENVANTFVTGNKFEGNLEVGAALNVGVDVSTASTYIQIGQGRTGSGYAFIDLVGDTTYTNYGLRIIRTNSGPNTESQIAHRGTGDLRLQTTDAADISFYTNAVQRMQITASGTVDVVGSLQAGRLIVDSGSTGSAALAFTGDGNTGLYSPGANQVAITTGGGQRLLVANQSVELGDDVVLMGTIGSAVGILGGAPESEFAFHPMMTNDFVGLANRTSSYTATSLNDSELNTITNGKGDFVSKTAAETLTFDHPRNFTWGQHYGVVFGSAGFRPSSLKIEIYYSGSWTTLLDTTNVKVHNHVYTSTSSNAATQVRITFGAAASTSYRIVHVYGFNYNKQEPVYVPRVGDSTIYGGLSLEDTTPYLSITESDAATDEKTTRILMTGGNLFIDALNDAASVAQELFGAIRSGVEWDYTRLFSHDHRWYASAGETTHYQRWYTDSGSGQILFEHRNASGSTLRARLQMATSGDFNFQDSAGSTYVHFSEADQRVGIGIVSPAHKLDVSGTLRATGAVTFSGLDAFDTGANKLIFLNSSDELATLNPPTTNGHVLQYSSGGGIIWGAAPAASSLGSIGDVTLTSLAGGDFLRYSGSAWVNVGPIQPNDLVGDAGDTVSGNGQILVIDDVSAPWTSASWTDELTHTINPSTHWDGSKSSTYTPAWDTQTMVINVTANITINVATNLTVGGQHLLVIHNASGSTRTITLSGSTARGSGLTSTSFTIDNGTHAVLSVARYEGSSGSGSEVFVNLVGDSV